jgi:hypothetical protein
MEKSSKRGKIPQQDWPSIIARYEAGETLASIARTYDCSPPAISYIVSRTKARSAAEAAAQTTPATAAEPQLLKGPSAEVPVSNIPAAAMLHGTAVPGAASALDLPVTEPRLIEQPAAVQQPREPELFPDERPHAPGLPANPLSSTGNGPIPRYGHVLPRGDHTPAGNGNAQRASGPAGGQPQNGESRRTLHLSLPQGNGSPHSPDSLPQSTPNFANAGSGERFNPHQTSAQSALGQPPRQGPIDQRPTPDSPDVAARTDAVSMRQPDGVRDTAPSRPSGEGQRGREGGAFIDRALRERVDGDIAVFLAAFDAALDHDTPETRTELREATDRLLRAGARTRIELERLEARAPLPTRDKIGQTAPFFRHR